MKFFEGVRASAFIQGAKLKADKKTGVRSWILTLAVTMESVRGCAESIVSNYAQISTQENRCGGIDVDEEPGMQRVEFFKLKDSESAELSMGHWAVSGLRMVKVEGLVELWIFAEHVNTDQLHRFVKDYAFTRMWLGFMPNAAAPDPSPVAQPSDVPVESIGSLIMNRVMDAMEGKSDDPAVNAAAARLVGGGLKSVTKSSGDRSVRIDAAGAKALKAKAAKKKV